jgi:hypothetical protein
MGEGGTEVAAIFQFAKADVVPKNLGRPRHIFVVEHMTVDSHLYLMLFDKK